MPAAGALRMSGRITGRWRSTNTTCGLGGGQKSQQGLRLESAGESVPCTARRARDAAVGTRRGGGCALGDVQHGFQRGCEPPLNGGETPRTRETSSKKRAWSDSSSAAVVLCGTDLRLGDPGWDPGRCGDCGVSEPAAVAGKRLAATGQ